MMTFRCIFLCLFQFFVSFIGTLMATGDAISQLVVERTHKFDVVRNGRFLVFGVFIGVSNPAPFIISLILLHCLKLIMIVLIVVSMAIQRGNLSILLVLE